jgi:hypothetical protein
MKQLEIIHNLELKKLNFKLVTEKNTETLRILIFASDQII